MKIAWAIYRGGTSHRPAEKPTTMRIDLPLINSAKPPTRTDQSALARTARLLMDGNVYVR